MCQGCVDEGRLSQETFDKIEAFRELWPDSEWGPGHIVISDDNVFDDNIQYSLDRLATYDAEDYGIPHSDEELAATKEFLESLLLIPEDDR